MRFDVVWKGRLDKHVGLQADRIAGAQLDGAQRRIGNPGCRRLVKTFILPEEAVSCS